MGQNFSLKKCISLKPFSTLETYDKMLYSAHSPSPRQRSLKTRRLNRSLLDANQIAVRQPKYRNNTFAYEYIETVMHFDLHLRHRHTRQETSRHACAGNIGLSAMQKGTLQRQVSLMLTTRKQLQELTPPTLFTSDPDVICQLWGFVTLAASCILLF